MTTTATAANGNGRSAASPKKRSRKSQAVVELPPQLTAAAFKKYLARESNPCGPGLLTTRIRAVGEAQRQDEEKLLAGALEDLAAAAVGWAYRIRAESGQWPKPGQS